MSESAVALVSLMMGQRACDTRTLLIILSRRRICVYTNTSS